MPQDSFTLPPEPPASLMGGDTQQGTPATTPKSAVQANPYGAAADKPQEPAYERPEQPLGHTPRNPLESIQNVGMGIAEGANSLIKHIHDLAFNQKTMKNGEYSQTGARDEWLKEWGRIAKRPDVRQEAEMKVLQDTWKGLIDPFRDDAGNFSLAHAAWEDPAGAAQSIYFLRDLAGGLMNTSGRLAGGVSRAALTADEVAQTAGKARLADRLVSIGERVQKFDPIGGTLGKISDLATRHTPLGDFLGIGPETKDVSAIIGNVKAEEDIAAHERAVSLARHKLSPEEAEQVMNLTDLGRAEDWQKATPAARAYVQTYSDKLLSPSERQLTESGFLTSEQKLLSRAQQASQRLYGDMERGHVLECLDKVKSGEFNPIYRHLATNKGDWYDLLDKLVKESGGAQGTVGFLEHRVGGGDYIKNPIEAALVQNDMYRQFNTKKRIIDEVTAHLQGKGLANAIAGTNELKRGQSVVPTDFWKKYLAAGQRAGGVAVAEKLAGATNEAATAKALEAVLKDRKALGAITNANDIAMPSHVARHLALELGIPGPLGRTYDKLFRYWKQGVTVLRPNYWLNVAAGNGVLAAIHGVRLDDAFRSYKYRDLLPAELRTSIGTVLRPGQGPIARRYNIVANTMGQLDSALHHTMVHAPIFATEAETARRSAMESMQALRRAGKSYFLSQDIVNSPEAWLKTVSAGPGDYAKALDNKVKFQEVLARQLPELAKAQQASERATQLHKAAIESVQTKLRSPQVATKMAALEDAHKSGGRAISQMQARLGALEDRYAVLSPESEEVTARAYADLTKKPITGVQEAAAEKLTQIPGFSKLKDPEAIRQAMGEVRQGVVARKQEELLSNLEDLKNKHYSAVKAEYESKMKDLQNAIGTQLDKASKAKALHSSLLQKLEAPEQVSQLGQRAQKLASDFASMKSEALETASRTGMVQEQLPKLQRIRDLAEQAIEPLNNFGGDYNRMHPLEKTWFRRAVPFYAWTKAMTKLVATLPYTYPTKTFLWNRWSQMMATAAGEDHHPAWLHGAIPIWDCDDGDTLYMRPFWNPLERTTTTRLGDTEFPNIADVWSNHPILKVGMEMRGGVDQYTMKPFSAPVNGVRRDTGEVYRLEPGGKMEKIIAQPNLLRSLYHLFPYSQYIDALLLSSKQTDRGWAGQQDPIRNPDGSIAHPTTLLQRLRDSFTPFRTTNMDKADRMELKTTMGTVKDYEAAIKKEHDPERREKMMTILRDWVDQWRRRQ